MAAKKILQKSWFYFLLYFVVLFSTMPWRAEDRIRDIWLSHIVLVIVVYCFAKWNAAGIRAILKGFLLGWLVALLLEQLETVVSGLWGDYLYLLLTLSFLLAIVSGYIIATSKAWYKKGLMAMISLVYCILAVNAAEPLLHYGNFGNFRGNVTKSLPAGKGFISESNDTVILDRISESKILLVDVWNTGCGVCFQEFPKLETLHKQYANDTNVTITAMFSPWERFPEPKEGIEHIRKKRYTFPVSVSFNGLDTALGIETYPKVFIVYNARIVFWGDLDNATRKLAALTAQNVAN